MSQQSTKVRSARVNYSGGSVKQSKKGGNGSGTCTHKRVPMEVLLASLYHYIISRHKRQLETGPSL
ncbi:hypothetical protein J6590_038796, partial [Homalodisca vitripennis]